MSKRKGAREGKGLFAAVETEVLARLGAGDRHDQVVLFVPSHDRDNRPLDDQNMWAEAAADLFADLYGGATAFKAHSGVFKTDKDEILRDSPIVLESYADRDNVENAENLTQLIEFSSRMGRETRQDTVGVVINDFIHHIKVPRK